MKISSLAIDASKNETGAWVKDIPGLDGVAFKVRALGNRDYRALQAKLVNAVPRVDRIRGLSVDQRIEIDTECLLQTVLLDWSGLEDDDGKPIKFGADIARKILADPRYDALREAVTWAATYIGDIGVADLEDAAKN